jgi:NTE family protein
MTQNPNSLGEVALILSGGGARGAYQAGVVKALAAAGVRVGAVAGASVGALNASIVASSPDLGTAATRLSELWSGLAALPSTELQLHPLLPPVRLGLYLTLLIAAGEDSRLAHMAATVTKTARTHVLRNRERRAAGEQDLFSIVLEQLLRFEPELAENPAVERLAATFFDEERLQEGLPLFVSTFRSHGVARDLGALIGSRLGFRDVDGSQYLQIQALPSGQRLAAVLASAALPLLFEAQVIGGEVHLDGGLGTWWGHTGNTPLTPILDQTGLRTVIVSHLTDGSLWDRRAYPDAVVIEIRPRTAITRDGLLADVAGVNPKRIASWIGQGEEDTKLTLKEIVEPLQNMSRGDDAREQRRTVIDSLQDRMAGEDKKPT